MKKKLLLATAAVIVFIVADFIYFYNAIPKGNTIESRESMLNSSIARGNNWSILKEIEIDGYIISAAHSADNRVTLAVFEPAGNGKYKFVSSTNRNNESIIYKGTVINGKKYDLIWFNGAETEYAEITYTINGQQQEPLCYHTADGDIIYHEISAGGYSVHIAYYDSDGNKYE